MATFTLTKDDKEVKFSLDEGESKREFRNVLREFGPELEELGYDTGVLAPGIVETATRSLGAGAVTLTAPLVAGVDAILGGEPPGLGDVEGLKMLKGLPLKATTTADERFMETFAAGEQLAGRMLAPTQYLTAKQPVRKMGSVGLPMAPIILSYMNPYTRYLAAASSGLRAYGGARQAGKSVQRSLIGGTAVGAVDAVLSSQLMPASRGLWRSGAAATGVTSKRAARFAQGLDAGTFAALETGLYNLAVGNPVYENMLAAGGMGTTLGLLFRPVPFAKPTVAKPPPPPTPTKPPSKPMPSGAQMEFDIPITGKPVKPPTGPQMEFDIPLDVSDVPKVEMEEVKRIIQTAANLRAAGKHKEASELAGTFFSSIAQEKVGQTTRFWPVSKRSLETLVYKLETDPSASPRTRKLLKRALAYYDHGTTPAKAIDAWAWAGQAASKLDDADPIAASMLRKLQRDLEMRFKERAINGAWEVEMPREMDLETRRIIESGQMEMELEPTGAQMGLPGAEGMPSPIRTAHTMDDIRNIASGEGTVRVYHGTSRNVANAVEEGGFKAPNRRAIVRAVAREYGIPVEKLEKRLVHDLNVSEDIVYTGNPYTALKYSGSEFELTVRQEAEVIAGPPYNRPIQRESVMIEVEVDASRLSGTDLNHAKWLVNEVDSGRMSESRAAEVWNTWFRELPVGPDDIRSARVVSGRQIEDLFGQPTDVKDIYARMRGRENILPHTQAAYMPDPKLAKIGAEVDLILHPDSKTARPILDAIDTTGDGSAVWLDEDHTRFAQALGTRAEPLRADFPGLFEEGGMGHFGTLLYLGYKRWRRLHLQEFAKTGTDAAADELLTPELFLKGTDFESKPLRAVAKILALKDPTLPDDAVISKTHLRKKSPVAWVDLKRFTEDKQLGKTTAETVVQYLEEERLTAGFLTGDVVDSSEKVLRSTIYMVNNRGELGTDAGSFVHELLHLLKSKLADTVGGLDDIEHVFGIKHGKWTVRDEENVVNHLMAFLTTEELPGNMKELEPVFEALSQHMRQYFDAAVTISGWRKWADKVLKPLGMVDYENRILGHHMTENTRDVIRRTIGFIDDDIAQTPFDVPPIGVSDADGLAAMRMRPKPPLAEVEKSYLKGMERLREKGIEYYNGRIAAIVAGTDYAKQKVSFKQLRKEALEMPFDEAIESVKRGDVGNYAAQERVQLEMAVRAGNIFDRVAEAKAQGITGLALNDVIRLANRDFFDFIESTIAPTRFMISDAGRKMRIWQDLAPFRIANTLELLEKELKGKPISEFRHDLINQAFQEMRAMQVSGTKDLTALSAILMQIPHPSIRTHIKQLYINNLLSGVGTQGVNVFNNAFRQFLYEPVHIEIRAIVDRLGVAWANPLLEMVGIAPKFEGKYYMRDIVPYISGMWYGKGKAWKGTKKVLMTGVAPYSEVKWRYTLGGIEAASVSDIKPIRAASPFINAPSRFMKAMDFMTASMAADAKLRTLAEHMALVKAGVGADKVAKRKAFLAVLKDFELPQEKWTEEMMNMFLESKEFARLMTLTETPGAYTSLALEIRDTFAKFAGGTGIGTAVAPFIVTRGSLFRRSMEMLPVVGLIARMPHWAGLFKKAGKSKYGLMRSTSKAGVWGEKTDWADLIAKQLEGLALITYGFSKAAKGELTGAYPDDPAERLAWQGMRRQPNSMIFPGCKQLVSIMMFEPVSVPVALGGILYDITHGRRKGELSEKEIQEQFTSAFFTAVEHLNNSNWSGPIMKTLARSGAGGHLQPNFLKNEAVNIASGLIPMSGLLRDVTRAYIGAKMPGPGSFVEKFLWTGRAPRRTQGTVVEELFRDVPFGPKPPVKLMVKGHFDEDGRPTDEVMVTVPSGIMRRVFGGGWDMEKSDFIDDEMDRLGWYPAPPRPTKMIVVRTKTGEKAEVPIPQDEYEKFCLLSMKYTKDRLAMLIRSRGYSNMPVEEKLNRCRQATEKARNAAAKFLKIDYYKDRW